MKHRNIRKESSIIGIPRALYYYTYPDLWETFFHYLDMKTVVSKPSTAQTVGRAGLISEAEHCLPMKLFDAHLAEVVDVADTVFIPRIHSSLKRHISCPKLGALPDAAKAEIARDRKVLTVEINEDKKPLSSSLSELGGQLGAHGNILHTAIARAMDAFKMAQHRGSSQPSGQDRRFLILGHPYNLDDPFISEPIFQKLKALNADVEVVGHDLSPLSPHPIRWDMCSRMYHTLAGLRCEEWGGVIQISSFNCGCDSITMEMFRDLLKKRKIPYLVLVLDEHSSQAGIETRLEAFWDSTAWHYGIAGNTTSG